MCCAQFEAYNFCRQRYISLHCDVIAANLRSACCVNAEGLRALHVVVKKLHAIT
jgi:hypothetical protein